MVRRGEAGVWRGTHCERRPHWPPHPLGRLLERGDDGGLGRGLGHLQGREGLAHAEGIHVVERGGDLKESQRPTSR